MNLKRRTIIVLCLWSAGWILPATYGQESQPATPAAEWLVIPSIGSGGRAPFHTDVIEAAIVAGTWTAPRAGEAVRLPDGSEKTWEAATPNENGELRHDALRGGYACWTFESANERAMLLDASGHSLAYINGSPRIGDVYGTDWVLLPVQVRAGTNVFLFRAGRGDLRVKLIEPPAEVCFSTRSAEPPARAPADAPPAERTPRDLTAPDLIRGESENVWAALPVLNATAQNQRELAIVAVYPDGRSLRTAAPSVPPLGLWKAGFQMPPAPEGATGEIPVELRLTRKSAEGEETLDMLTIKVGIRDSSEKHKRTFISAIDGSVQYFGVTPAKSGAGETADALFLSLHGAGVEASGQAGAYESKNWGNLVAATNRRPFGFDWEDWGRLDALEVLGVAERMFQPDPRRVYLTGHSMGGHGVWQVGVNAPGRFAAIAPSASWPDFWSYAGAAEYEDPTPIEQILQRAVAPSRTLEMIRNCGMYGVYILHGDADETVPVELARRMRGVLAEFHPDFAYYEYPGGSHWWGSGCVDWPPLFDFFKNHTRRAAGDVRHVEFHTNNPAVSSGAYWASIEAQLRQNETSSLTIDLDPEKRLFTATAQNVARFAIDLRELCDKAKSRTKGGDADSEAILPAGTPLSVRVDDQLMENIPWPESDGRLWFRRDDDHWTAISRPDPFEKGPARYGPFKHAFDRRFLFVYGTGGTGEMGRLLFEKARFDAETFWYRGNGAVELMPDAEFDPSKEKDRSVILYGNAENNAAWAALLGDSPVQVKNGTVQIGRREIAGDNLACLFVRPRPGSDIALVGVVSGTGPSGLRVTERLPFFLSGVAYPDCIAFGADVLSVGTEAIRAAGFFGLDWQVESGDFAWRDPEPAK